MGDTRQGDRRSLWAWPRRGTSPRSIALLAATATWSAGAPARAAKDPLDTPLPRPAAEKWRDDGRLAAGLAALPTEQAAEARGWLEENARVLDAAKRKRWCLRDALGRARAEDAALLRSLCRDADGIRRAEAAYDAAFAEVVPAGPAPRTLEELPPGGVPWAEDPGFKTLGWAPGGPREAVRSVFEVALFNDGEGGEPTFRITVTARLWSGRQVTCLADPADPARFDADTDAFVGTPDGQAIWLAPIPLGEEREVREAVDTKSSRTGGAVRGEVAAVDSAEASARATLDLVEAASGGPDAVGLRESEGIASLPGHEEWSRCGAGLTRTGLGFARRPFAACPLSCEGASLPDRKGGSAWDRPGDGTLARTLAEGCSPTRSLTWIPKRDRERIRPADLLVLLTLLEPLKAASGGDRRLEARARRVARTLVRTALHAREDGLAARLDLLLGAIVNVDPRQKLEILLAGLVETAREWHGGTAVSSLDRAVWDNGQWTDEQRAASQMALAGGACMDATQARGWASRLAGMGPAEAQAHLLAACDAKGPDPIYAGPLEDISVPGWAGPSGTESERLARRARGFWGTYWLARTTAEPVLADLDRVGSPASRTLAANVRSTLMGLLPERPDLVASIHAAVEEVRAAEGEHRLLVAAAKLGGLAIAGHLVPRSHSVLVRASTEFTGADAAFLSYGLGMDPECPDAGSIPDRPGAMSPANACLVRAFIAEMAAPLLGAVENDPAGTEAAAKLRELMTELGIPAAPKR